MYTTQDIIRDLVLFSVIFILLLIAVFAPGAKKGDEGIWFAWYPVRTVDGELIWLRKVRFELRTWGFGADGFDFRYDYHKIY